MSKPTSYPQWDSNATHTTALVAGHKTDGFAADEVPTSDELNELFMLIYLWLVWLDGRNAYTQRYSWSDIVKPSTSDASVGSISDGTPRTHVTTTGLEVPLFIPSGFTIREIRLRAKQTSHQFAVSLYKVVDGVSSVVVAAVLSATSGVKQTVTLPAINVKPGPLEFFRVTFGMPLDDSDDYYGLEVDIDDAP